MSSFIVEDWMMADGLGLKGCELFLFALVYSYSKAGKTMFESEQSLGERFGYSRRCIGKALDSLERRGLIIRMNKHPGRQSFDYSCDFSSQQGEKKVHTKMRNNVTAAREESSHNNNRDKYKNTRYNENFRRCITDVPERFSGHDTVQTDKD